MRFARSSSSPRAVRSAFTASALALGARSIRSRTDSTAGTREFYRGRAVHDEGPASSAGPIAFVKLQELEISP